MDLQFASTGNASTASTPSIQARQWPYYCLSIILSYPILTTFLRNQRIRNTKKAFSYNTRASFARMTDEDAYKIQLDVSQYEFPFIFQKALQFALFRTYGIPTISKLLVATSQLSDVATASKRYADTAVLIREFTSHRPSDPRTLEAVARMNYIHSMYQKSGAIKNDDMLFTLSLFALEPLRWIQRYEWRELEEFEKCAVGTFWKSIGDAMGIDYHQLRSFKEGWADGLQWLDDVEEWSNRYEEDHMVPNIDNHKTANETVSILLWGVPDTLRPVGERLVSAVMDDRLRAAMMYDKPTQIYFTFLHIILGIRRFLLRYLCLPRIYPLNEMEEPGPDGRRALRVWEGAPYYVRPTFWRRWGPPAWTSRLVGLPVPGDEGERYYPKGYQLLDVGPDIMFGKGAKSAKETIDGLRRTRTGGCPFVMANGE